MDKDRVLLHSAQKEFLRDSIPSQKLDSEDYIKLINQIHDINLALLQKDEGAISKFKNFLDKTIIEF